MTFIFRFRMSILWRTNLPCAKLRSFQSRVGKAPARSILRNNSWNAKPKEMIKKMTLPAIVVLAWTDLGLWSIFTYLYYHDKVPKLVEYLSDTTSANLQTPPDGPKSGFMAKYFDLETDTKLAEGIVIGALARKFLFPLPFKIMVSMFMGGVFNYSKLLYMIIMGPLWASFFLIVISFK